MIQVVSIALPFHAQKSSFVFSYIEPIIDAVMRCNRRKNKGSSIHIQGMPSMKEPWDLPEYPWPLWREQGVI